MFSLNFKIKIVKCAVPPYMIPMLTPVLAVIDNLSYGTGTLGKRRKATAGVADRKSMTLSRFQSGTSLSSNAPAPLLYKCVRTTRITGGLHSPYKGVILAAPQGAVKRSADRISLQAAPLSGAVFICSYWPAHP